MCDSGEVSVVGCFCDGMWFECLYCIEGLFVSWCKNIDCIDDCIGVLYSLID